MRLLVGLAIAGSLLAACSGNSGTSSTTTTSSAGTTTSETTTSSAATTTSTAPTTSTTTTSSAATTTSTAVTTGTAATTGWVTYTGADGLAFLHPASWTVTHGSSGPLYVYIDPSSGVPFRRNVNLQLESSSSPLTEAGFLQTNLAQITQDKGAISQQGTVSFDGTPGYRIVWAATVTISGTAYDLEFLSQWTIRNGEAWLLTYTADSARFESALPMVASLLASLKLPT